MIYTKKIGLNINGLVVKVLNRFQGQNIGVGRFTIKC